MRNFMLISSSLNIFSGTDIQSFIDAAASYQTFSILDTFFVDVYSKCLNSI